jgi:6-phosphogluconolactonase
MTAQEKNSARSFSPNSKVLFCAKFPIPKELKMQSVARGLFAAIFSVGVLTPAIHAIGIDHAQPATVYVMTNDAGENEILTYQQVLGGDFVAKSHVRTGGRGSGGSTDPLQSQGSLTLSQDHNLLFAVNAGSGTISSFHLVNGLPVLIDHEPTGGAFPVAVAEHNGTIYVLNAGGNGAIVAFRVDGPGRLHKIQESTVELTALNDGASSISISPDGLTLVVIEKGPNNIATFPIHPDGTLGAVVVNHSVTPGVFSAIFAPNGVLIVSENQPGGTDVSSISSYTIHADGKIQVISQSVPSFGDGNCWNVITPDGKFVYVDNAATSTVAGFSVDTNGTLAPIAGTILATEPAGAANLDMSISANGQLLFTLNSGHGNVSVYHINSNGTLTLLGNIDGLPMSAGFNGIAAL